MQKMLGTLEGARIEPAPFVVSAHANRVPVEHGHTVVMSASSSGRSRASAKPSPSSATGKARCASLNLPSAPERPLVLAEQPDRPQPRRDVNLGNGMTVTVGRVREDAIFHLKLVAMGHNTIRGAAGGAVLNAEVLATTGRLGWTPPDRR
jgi:aspartate-semialdehyde dehydrogenase